MYTSYIIIHHLSDFKYIKNKPAPSAFFPHVFIEPKKTTDKTDMMPSGSSAPAASKASSDFRRFSNCARRFTCGRDVSVSWQRRQMTWWIQRWNLRLKQILCTQWLVNQLDEQKQIETENKEADTQSFFTESLVCTCVWSKGSTFHIPRHQW